MKVFEALAGAFIAEGTRVVFGLMGDGNMYWMAQMGRDGAQLVHARHENAAVAMADGYARVTGEVGVASVTAGPGLTQIGTSLTASVRHRTPVVVFAGDTPHAAAFNLQEFEQAPFVTSCGAGYVAANRPDRAAEDVALAFYRARHERRPIVVGAPWDLQEATYPWELEPVPSGRMVPPYQRIAPDPVAVDDAVDLLLRAERPVVLAGRGAVAAQARGAVDAVAERIGALLATTVRAKGWFDDAEWNIGICGAFSSAAAREVLAGADFVLGVGARMGYFTTEAGYLFPDATIVQIDADPVGYIDGQRVADVFVRGDAAVTLEALEAALARKGHSVRGLRTPEVRAALDAPAPAEPTYTIPPGTVDPRSAMREIDGAVPADWRVVIGAGHFWNFAVGILSGRAPDRYVYTYDFGVIGQGLPTAIGVAAATGEPTALIEGDGSILMHIQELEALARHPLPVLALVIDDGAYGAEIHKMRAKGFTDDEAVFGYPDLAGVATAFGLRGRRVEGDGQLAAVVEEFRTDPRPTVVDIRVAADVMAPTYRRLFYGEA